MIYKLGIKVINIYKELGSYICLSLQLKEIIQLNLQGSIIYINYITYTYTHTSFYGFL